MAPRTGLGVNRAAQALRMSTQSLYRSRSALGDFFRRRRTSVGTRGRLPTPPTRWRASSTIWCRHVLYDDAVLFREQH